ncbi:MAG: hypothetical protein WC076_00210 [Terrimicrobiaceae bacterium]|jgi:hypothetical protein
MTPEAWLVGEAAATPTDWGLLLVILGGIFLFMLLVRVVGLILAATHPVPPLVAKGTGSATDPERSREPDPKILAIIAVAVSEVLGQPHRIVAVKKAPSVESLMQHWSMEGRRAIYSSHKFR